MSQTQEVRQLKDYDVLGVGASRREEIAKNSSPIVLVTHPSLWSFSQKGFYASLLKETLGWLKPSEVWEEKINKPVEDYLLEILLNDFHKEFPQTANFLRHNLREVLNEYLKEFPWEGSLLTAHFRYFLAFLRQKSRDPRLYMIAQKEWLWSYLSFADFGLPASENGRVLVNPSLQSFYADSEVEEVQVTPGLWLVYYDYSRRKVRDYKMDIWDAALVDLLQEDRKYNLNQVVEQVLVGEPVTSLSREEWQKKLHYLIEQGILLKMDSQENFIQKY